MMTETTVDYAPEITISLEGGLALLEEGLGVLYFKNLKTGKITANVIARGDCFRLGDDGTWSWCTQCEHCGKVAGIKR